MQRTAMTGEEKFRQMTMTPIPKLILHLGIPTIASMLITNVYNMTDTYFVGQLGKSASGAIGIVYSLMAIFQAFGFMFGHGAGSNISRRLGQHDTQSASRYASTGFFLSLALGLIIGAVGLLFLTPLMYLLGSTDTILPYARDYGISILLAGPLFTGSCVLNNILRYEGMSFQAMIGLVSGGILNMVMDPIFIFVFHMGTAGAGISTALSQAASFFILLYMFLAGKTESKLSLRYFTRKMSDVWLTVATGLPSLLRQGLTSLSGLVLNHQAAVYGDAAVAAMSIVNRISGFIFSLGLGMGQGYQPVAAFNYGAGCYSRVRKGFWFTALAGEVLLGIAAVGCFLFAHPMIALFQSDAEVVAMGTLPAPLGLRQYDVPERGVRRAGVAPLVHAKRPLLPAPHRRAARFFRAPGHSDRPAHQRCIDLRPLPAPGAAVYAQLAQGSPGGRLSLLPALADVNPGVGISVGHELGNGQLNGAVAAAAGGVHRLKPAQRLIQVHRHALLHREGTHTAHGVPHIFRHLVVGQHLGLGVKLRLELGVIHLGVSRGHDEHALIPHQKREGLGNALALHAQRLGGQLHGGAGHGKFLHPVFNAFFPEKGADFFNGHERFLRFHIKSSLLYHRAPGDATRPGGLEAKK